MHGASASSLASFFVFFLFVKKQERKEIAIEKKSYEFKSGDHIK
jgi:hypothetical protein